MNTQQAIAIAELIVYSPLLIVAVYINARHGFSRQLGWFFLLIFCGLRIAGAVVEILSVHNPTNISDATWAAILNSIGLSPLLLAALGMLKRVNDSIDLRSWRVRAIQLIQIPCLVGLILGIVGGTNLQSTDPAKTSSGMGYLKGAGILFLVAYVALCALSGLTTSFLRGFARSEFRILLAILGSLPFLAVRVLYSLLVDFANNGNFSIIHGNPLVRLGMSVIEEFVVAVVFILVGVSADPMSNQAAEQHVPLGKHGQPEQVPPMGRYNQQWHNQV